MAQKKDGTDKPIAYYSRKMRPAELNYSVTEKECLAVVERVKAFAIYLLGPILCWSLTTKHLKPCRKPLELEPEW